MSRIIKYRGKVDGVWQQVTPDDLHRWEQFWAFVDRETVGQYTGLNDKNKQEVYEGDILQIAGATAKVVFWERPPEFGLDFSHDENAWCEDWTLTDDSHRMEIIGNSYDHPHFLLHNPFV